MIRASIALALALALLAAAAADAKPRLLDKFDAWDATVDKRGKERICYVSSLPTKSTGRYKKRGEASIIIAHWPKRKRWGEVTVNAGYRHKKKTEVLISIGGAPLRLFTSGGQAYAYRGEDARLVRAMKAGARMTVTGISSKGTRTLDTYSLRGISNALKAIDAECRGKGYKPRKKPKKPKTRKKPAAAKKKK